MPWGGAYREAARAAAQWPGARSRPASGVYRGRRIPEVACRPRGKHRDTQDGASDEDTGHHGERGHDSRSCPACPQPTAAHAIRPDHVHIGGYHMEPPAQLSSTTLPGLRPSQPSTSTNRIVATRGPVIQAALDRVLPQERLRDHQRRAQDCGLSERFRLGPRVLQRDPARSTRDLMPSLPEHLAQMERDRVRADDPGRSVAAASNWSAVMRHCVNTTYAAFTEVRKMHRHSCRFVASRPFVKRIGRNGTWCSAPCPAPRASRTASSTNRTGDAGPPWPWRRWSDEAGRRAGGAAGPDGLGVAPRAA